MGSSVSARDATVAAEVGEYTQVPQVSSLRALLKFVIGGGAGLLSSLLQQQVRTSAAALEQQHCEPWHFEVARSPGESAQWMAPHKV
jgi:hypothetical protein